MCTPRPPASATQPTQHITHTPHTHVNKKANSTTSPAWGFPSCSAVSSSPLFLSASSLSRSREISLWVSVYTGWSQVFQGYFFSCSTHRLSGVRDHRYSTRARRRVLNTQTYARRGVQASHTKNHSGSSFRFRHHEGGPGRRDTDSEFTHNSGYRYELCIVKSLVCPPKATRSLIDSLTHSLTHSLTKAFQLFATVSLDFTKVLGVLVSVVVGAIFILGPAVVQQL